MNLVKKVMSIFSLKNYLASNGVVLNDAMGSAVLKWDSMYKNNRKLSLASAIASETARLATLEMKSRVSGSKRAEFLNKSYGEVLKNIRTITETACAKGGIVLKPYVNKGKIYVSIVQAENFLPISYDESGRITDCVFLDRFASGKNVYTRIERHTMDGMLYVIRNDAFVSAGGDLGKPVNLKDTKIWSNISPYVSCTGVTKPIFGYIKMPMANNIDVGSPLGISVYSKVESLIDDAEKQYERLIWEFESGERALYIDESAIGRDRNGNKILPDKRLYRMLNTGNDELFKDWTPTLRSEQLAEGLNEILRRLEFGVGLAYGTLSDIQNVDRTAEEFRASKERSYTHICEIQTCLKNGLYDLIDAINTLTDLYQLEENGEYFVSFDFDDSIMADRKTEFDEKIRLLESGIIEPWELRAWYFGEEESLAKEKMCGKGKLYEKRRA